MQQFCWLGDPEIVLALTKTNDYGSNDDIIVDTIHVKADGSILQALVEAVLMDQPVEISDFYIKDTRINDRNSALPAVWVDLVTDLRKSTVVCVMPQSTRGDYTTALRILRPLANNGCAEAQYALGSAYLSGEGVQEDYAEAMKWYRHAADQGSCAARLMVSKMYENGEGVSPTDGLSSITEGQCPARNIGSLTPTSGPTRAVAGTDGSCQ